MKNDFQDARRAFASGSARARRGLAGLMCTASFLSLAGCGALLGLEDTVEAVEAGAPPGDGDAGDGELDAGGPDSEAPADDGGETQGDGGDRSSDAGERDGGEADAGDIQDGKPRIASISPASGAVGVAEDTPIVIRFNQPMKPATFSLEASVSVLGWRDGAIEELPVSAFTWNEDGTELTLRAALFYATYDVVLSEDQVLPSELFSPARFLVAFDPGVLTNQESEPLAEGVTSSFSTKVRIVQRIDRAVEHGLFGNLLKDSDKIGGWLMTGDHPEREVRGYVSFHLESLGEVDTIEQAAIDTFVWYTAGDPLAKYRDLHLDHVVFEDVVEAASTGWNTPPLHLATAIARGSFTYKDQVNHWIPGEAAPIAIKDESDFVHVDVSEAVRDDVLRGRSLSQYCLYFPEFDGVALDGVYDEMLLYNSIPHGARQLLAPSAIPALEARLGHPLDTFKTFPILTVQYLLAQPDP
jgi:hypothetical protein